MTDLPADACSHPSLYFYIFWGGFKNSFVPLHLSIDVASLVDCLNVTHFFWCYACFGDALQCSMLTWMVVALLYSLCSTGKYHSTSRIGRHLRDLWTTFCSIKTRLHTSCRPQACLCIRHVIRYTLYKWILTVKYCTLKWPYRSTPSEFWMLFVNFLSWNKLQEGSMLVCICAFLLFGLVDLASLHWASMPCVGLLPFEKM